MIDALLVSFQSDHSARSLQTLLALIIIKCTCYRAPFYLNIFSSQQFKCVKFDHNKNEYLLLHSHASIPCTTVVLKGHFIYVVIEHIGCDSLIIQRCIIMNFCENTTERVYVTGHVRLKLMWQHPFCKVKVDNVLWCY